MTTHWPRALSFVLFLACLSLRAQSCPMTLPELVVSVAGRPLTVELAVTPDQRECGLSRRDTLPASRGMLFVFPAPVETPFWMKDTRIPLAIAFLDAQGRIIAISHMTPEQPGKLHHPPGPYRYALEVNEGWFSRHGVAAGDDIRFEPPTSGDAM